MYFVSLLNSSIHGKDQTNPLIDFSPIFSTYGIYLFCIALLARNILQYMIPHVGRNWAWLAAINQVTWGLPAFMGFTGFNFYGFFHYVAKVFKEYSDPYRFYPL